MIIKEKNFLYNLYQEQPNKYGNKIMNESLTIKYNWIVSRIISNKFKPNSSILDVGCQAGGLSIILSMLGYNCTAFDLSKGYLDFVKQNSKNNRVNIKTVQGFAQELDNHFSKEQFDVIVMSSVLEHLYEAKEVFNNTKNILKKNGLLIALVPIQTSFKGYDHVIFFDDSNINSYFKNCVIDKLIFKKNNPKKLGWYTILFRENN